MIWKKPLVLYRYLRRVHNYSILNARASVLYWFCRSKEDLHYRLNRSKYWKTK